MQLNDPTDSVAELSIARRLNELGAKLVYSPMQTMGTLGRKYQVALTLHDLIYYRHKTPPAEFSRLIKFGWRLFHLTYLPQRFVLNRADAVITVSQTTADLIRKHRLTNKPVSVVYNAGSSRPVPKPRKFAKANKALVYMGSFMGYKNVETLVRAIALLEEFELHLLSRISDARKRELLSLAGAAANRIRFFGGVSDERYLEELDSAFALVSASLDEGFGIPLIEAMERATPVVVSDLDIFKEVGGSAAKYFAATDAQALADRIQELNSAEAWNRASQESLTQAEKFSWDKSAAALVAALAKL